MNGLKREYQLGRFFVAYFGALESLVRLRLRLRLRQIIRQGVRLNWPSLAKLTARASGYNGQAWPNYRPGRPVKMARLGQIIRQGIRLKRPSLAKIIARICGENGLFAPPVKSSEAVLGPSWALGTLPKPSRGPEEASLGPEALV